MTELLGSRDCIESLRSDVSDLQLAISDVLSRVGPVTFRSWKYPYKESSALDVKELLEKYDYSEDLEERQTSHIILLELVIDRLILLLQAMGRFLEQTLRKTGSSMRPAKSSSVGIIVKKYWNALLHLNTMLDQMNSENKSKTRRISDLEALLAKANEKCDQPQDRPFGNSDKPVVGTGNTLSSASKSSIASPGRDEYNKATQTVETAFVPCDSCYLVQQNLREVGEVVVNTCQLLGLESCLSRHRIGVQKIDWFSANDVKQWTVEQGKDLASIGKHLDWLMSTVNPLKAELAIEQKKNKDMSVNVDKCIEQVKVERQTSAAMRKQYEGKLKDLEKSRADLTAELEQLKVETNKIRKGLEDDLGKTRAELSRKKEELCELENSHREILREMQERLANNEAVRQMEENMNKMDLQLNDISLKLEEAAVELRKEKAVNRSASKINETEQSKQEALRQRLDEIDRENELLRNQIADLEDARDQLQEKVSTMETEGKDFQRMIKDKERLEKDNARLEGSIRQLEENASRLEKELKDVKEQMRLLIEYPELHQIPNANFAGTGDIAKDMENQLQANHLRIQVLHEENAKLQKSISKLLSMTQAGQKLDNGNPFAKPVPLWRHNEQDRFDSNNSTQPELHLNDVIDPRQRASKGLNDGSLFQPSVPRQETSGSRRSITVGPRIVSASSHQRYDQANAKDPELKWRKATLSDATDVASNKKFAGHSFVGGRQAPSNAQGKHYPDDTYTCPKCDKMYRTSKELNIHQSYCYGGL